MPICEVCDGESFYDEDGLFYCDGCNTQSQDVQVELKQEVNFANYTIDTATLGLKTTVKRKRRSRHYDLGKPWLAYEGYQYMIKSQVESLIAMGFNEKLKDCVGKIWFHYLKLKKVAFCSEEPEVITLAAHSKRTKNEFELPPCMKMRKGLVKIEEDAGIEKEDASKGDSFDLNKEIDDLDKLRVLSDEEMNAHEHSDSVEDSSDEENCSTIGSIRLTENNPSIFEMKQHYTISFCYIGLLLLQEPVFFSDLLRWTHEGMIPYHKASVVLPPEMKFASKDYQHFCNRRKLNVWTASSSVHDMCTCLSIKTTHGKEYLKLLVALVVVDLELSSSVQHLAWYLIDADFILKESKAKHFIMDGPVSAYVIVAMKFIYYLDDNHEMKNQVRNTVLDLLKLPPVESWKKWVTRSMLKRKKKLYNGIPREEEDLKYIRDLSVYEDYCIKDSFKDFDNRATSSSFCINQGKWRRSTKDPKEQYFKPFYSVAQVLNPSLDFENIKRLPTSFPSSVDHLGGLVRYDMHNDVTYGTSSCMTESINNVGMNYRDKKGNNGICITENNNNVALNNGDKKDIGSCDTENVDLDHGNKSNASPLFSRVNAATNASNKKNDIIRGFHDEDEANNPRIISIGENLEKDVNATIRDLDETNMKVFNSEHKPTSRHRKHVKGNKSSIDDVECSDKYLYYNNSQEEDKWHDSYRYLIGVISKKMEMRPFDIQFHVRKLEQRYFVTQMRENATTAANYFQGPCI